jgi:hypothetical protein
MVRLRERQEVHPDAKVVRYGKTFASLEDYLLWLLDAQYNAGLEAAEGAVEKSSWSEHYREPSERLLGYGEGIKAARQSIRALRRGKPE